MATKGHVVVSPEERQMNSWGSRTVSMFRQYHSHVLASVTGIVFVLALAAVIIWFRESHDCRHDSYSECSLSFQDLCERTTDNYFDRVACQCRKCNSCKHRINDSASRIWQQSVCQVQNDAEPSKDEKERLGVMMKQMHDKLEIPY